MLDILSVSNVMANIGSYQMSWIEFIGTLSGLICVYLASREKVLSWPIGLINSLSFLVIFWQVNLYSDVFLQTFFTIQGLYGWYRWTHPVLGDRIKTNGELGITKLTKSSLAAYLVCTGLATALMGYGMSHIHELLPSLFKDSAAFPYLDSLIAVASVVATILLTKKKLEAWYFWMAIDVLAVGVYYAKDVRVIAAEYVVFFFIAASGLLKWRKSI